jgi:glycine/D-amino acid oxidase-like deaminating enzyme
MKIAILGAGLAGLATCYYLQKRPGVKISLYDAVGIGGGASGLAAGLLHTRGGAEAKKTRHGETGLQATLELIKAAEEALGSPCAKKTGLLRLATFEKQLNSYKQAAESKDVQWWDNKRCLKEVEGISDNPGIFIEDAWVVDTPLYLQGLFAACKQGNVCLKIEKVQSLKEFAGFDKIIVCLGDKTTRLPELSHLPLARLKGQILEVAWEKPIPFPLNSQSYLLQKGERLVVGATFEREFLDDNVDIETAKKEILPKACLILPKIAESQVLLCKAGVRATTRDKLPLILEPLPGVWVFSGLGSKGLIFHALYAKELVARVFEGNK